MDFNPDEAIAAGWLRPDSLPARLLDRMSRFSLRQANRVIALDRFMRDRIVAKGIPPANVVVIPPWAHDTEVKFDPEGRERFRKAHGLDGKFVVMYSGNHSPCHPLETLLAAARQLAADPGVVFCFVGGGSEWRKIQQMAGQNVAQASPPASSASIPAGKSPDSPTQSSKLDVRGSTFAVRPPHPSPVSPNVAQASPPASSASIPAGKSPNSPTQSSKFEVASPSSASPLRPPPRPSPNILCLPYQPLDQLSGSLSAADLHVVVMGDPFVGLVHPCKIYNILAVGAPVLYIGPRLSHVSEIANSANGEVLCLSAGHGEAETVVKHIQHVRDGADQLSRHPSPLVRSLFSKETVLPKLIAELV